MGVPASIYFLCNLMQSTTTLLKITHDSRRKSFLPSPCCQEQPYVHLSSFHLLVRSPVQLLTLPAYLGSSEG